jgi:hypothetical protein
VIEAVVFALPLTALLGLGVTTISITGENGFWPFGAIDLITVLALVAVSAGWALIVIAIQGGAEGLRKATSGWWFAVSLGSISVLAAAVSVC